MKTLFLLRHAKSSWKEAGLADFDRPLNERGRRAAPFMGKLVKERGLSPDLIISSPARRARKTAKLFKEAGDFAAGIAFDDRIYEASANTLLYVIGEADNSLDSLMIVGHNPGMEGLVQVLTAESEPMPTAAVAVINLDIDEWKQVRPASGRVAVILRPREEMS